MHRIILDREMKEALLLVFANKQDIPGAMSPQEVQDKLKLNQLKDKIWSVVPSCATTGDGLFEGLVSRCATSQKRRPRTDMNCTGLAIEQRQVTSDTAEQVTLPLHETIVQLRLPFSLQRCFWIPSFYHLAT